MKKSALALAATLALAVAAPASAAQYLFQFSGTNLFGPPAQTMGSGVFTTSDVATQVGGQTAFAITGITGTVNGSNIVAPTGSYGNYFTTGPAFLDGTGLRFFTAAGTDVRVFFQDTVSQYRVNTFSPGATGFVTATSSALAGAVPEPATWAMMLVGFGGLGAMLRRRRPTLATA
jgi:hypothetical protein